MAAPTKSGTLARKYKDLQRDMSRAANAAMRKTMQYAKETAKETTSFKDRTGELRRSIQSGVTHDASPSQPVVVGALSAGYPEFSYTDPSGRIVSTEVYAPIVELGTTKKNYEISPGRSEVLAHSGSKNHPKFGPVHRPIVHPGLGPRPFIWPTMMQMAAQNVLGMTLEAALAGLYP